MWAFIAGLTVGLIALHIYRLNLLSMADSHRLEAEEIGGNKLVIMHLEDYWLLQQRVMIAERQLIAGEQADVSDKD